MYMHFIFDIILHIQLLHKKMMRIFFARIFYLSPALSFSEDEEIKVLIDPEINYQKIDGFGASDAWRTQFVGNN